MTPDEAIRVVDSKSKGRTRYEGQESFVDEILVAEIRRLWKDRQELIKLLHRCDEHLDDCDDYPRELYDDITFVLEGGRPVSDDGSNLEKT